MRDYPVWGPALIVTFLYGLLALFGFDQARDEAIGAPVATAVPYVLFTGVGFVIGGLVLGAVTHTLARQLGGTGSWQPTVGLSMLIMSITDAPRLIFAVFLGGENSLVQILGWLTWLAAGALFTSMVSKSHDLPWPKALGASGHPADRAAVDHQAGHDLSLRLGAAHEKAPGRASCAPGGLSRTTRAPTHVRTTSVRHPYRRRDGTGLRVQNLPGPPHDGLLDAPGEVDPLIGLLPHVLALHEGVGLLVDDGAADLGDMVDAEVVDESLSVLPVSATSSAIRTFLSEKSIALGTGASMTGISRVVPTPVLELHIHQMDVLAVERVGEPARDEDPTASDAQHDIGLIPVVGDGLRQLAHRPARSPRM
ncbi:hypothetical protein SMICM304S_05172 [Streptomyces microflavus]